MGVLDGCHKIGMSSNPKRRAADIGAMLPVAIKIVHVVPTANMRWLERYLHVAFRHRRARGEWFRLSEEEVGLIAAIPAADSIADLPSAVVALHEQNWSGLYPSRQLNVRLEPDAAERFDRLLLRMQTVVGVELTPAQLIALALVALEEKHPEPKKGKK